MNKLNNLSRLVIISDNYNALSRYVGLVKTLVVVTKLTLNINVIQFYLYGRCIKIVYFCSFINVFI